MAPPNAFGGAFSFTTWTQIQGVEPMFFRIEKKEYFQAKAETQLTDIATVPRK
jgi:hypothetical protein